MRFFERKPPESLRPPNVRVIRELDAEARYVVIAAELDGRSLYMVWDTAADAPASSEVFGTEGAAVAWWLRSHPWTPDQGLEACVVCDAGTKHALAFAGTSDFVGASLRELGVSEETTRTIVQADARLKGREPDQEAPFNTVVGVPLCTDCAGRMGREVAVIGSKIPTYGMADQTS
jgi:hypothetical protein